MKNDQYNLNELYDILKQNNNDFNAKIPFSHPSKTNGKLKNVLLGRLIVNQAFPDDYPFIDEPLDKKKVGKLLNDIANKYSPAIAADSCTKLNSIAFMLATINPITFNADSFNVPPDLMKRKKELLNQNLPPDEFTANVKKLGEEYMEWLKVNDNGLYDIVMGAGKYTPMDLGVLLFAKGPMVDIEGNITKPTLSSVNGGFDLESWYASANQSRNVLFVRSMGSSEPGALAREVNYSCSNIQLEHDTDCKTKKYLELLITPSIRGTVDGRWFMNEQTSALEKITSKTDITGKTIKLRSPIYCKQKNNNICSYCYGELGERLETHNIGLLAGSVINILGLNNYSMKVRHASSQVNIRKVNFLNDFIRS